MSNQAALVNLLEWWRAIPDAKRPAHQGRFHLSAAEAELYVLDLREKWATCGARILNLCNPHREKLEVEARAAVGDFLAWLDLVEASVLRVKGVSAPILKDVGGWLAESRERLNRVVETPLAEPFGLTLGIGRNSSLLANFRWWGTLENSPVGHDGPVRRIPDSVVSSWELGAKRDVLSDYEVAWVRAFQQFPESVMELNYAQAKSPWTAAFLLNWLLSNKGVLRKSNLAPSVDGPSAVPSARAWLDQMESVFVPWYEKRVADCPDPEQKFILPIICPVIPSAFVVPPGHDALDIKGLHRGAIGALSAEQGQCCTFEFLLSRIAELASPELESESELKTVPRLVIKDGERRKTFILEVGIAGEEQKISKGAANLLYTLGLNGACTKVRASNVNDLRKAFPGVDDHFTAKKKIDNVYLICEGKALRGQVLWKATERPTPLT